MRAAFDSQPAPVPPDLNSAIRAARAKEAK
jgi:hypothetical protein